jgi:hypothetical protein
MEGNTIWACDERWVGAARPKSTSVAPVTAPRADKSDSTPKPRASLQSVVSYTRDTIGLVWRSSPPLTLALAALTLLASGLPLGIAYAGKRIVDAVVGGSREDTVVWVVLELLVVSVSWARASASTSTWPSSRRR